MFTAAIRVDGAVKRHIGALIFGNHTARAINAKGGFQARRFHSVTATITVGKGIAGLHQPAIIPCMMRKFFKPAIGIGNRPAPLVCTGGQQGRVRRGGVAGIGAWHGAGPHGGTPMVKGAFMRAANIEQNKNIAIVKPFFCLVRAMFEWF
jgi:hypothetical protein